MAHRQIGAIAATRRHAPGEIPGLALWLNYDPIRPK